LAENRVTQKAGNFLTSRVTLQDVGERCSSVVQKFAWILLQCMRLHCAALIGSGGRGLCFRFCVQRKLFCVCGSAFFAALHIKINQYSHGAYISWSTLTIDAEISSEMLAANYQSKRKHIWCVCSTCTLSSVLRAGRAPKFIFEL